MKSLFRLFAFAVTVVFILVAVIKYVRGCSWKEAVGIFEELCKEFKESCHCCKNSETVV